MLAETDIVNYTEVNILFCKYIVRECGPCNAVIFCINSKQRVNNKNFSDEEP